MLLFCYYQFSVLGFSTGIDLNEVYARGEFVALDVCKIVACVTHPKMLCGDIASADVKNAYGYLGVLFQLERDRGVAVGGVRENM